MYKTPLLFFTFLSRHIQKTLSNILSGIAATDCCWRVDLACFTLAYTHWFLVSSLCRLDPFDLGCLRVEYWRLSSSSLPWYRNIYQWTISCWIKVLPYFTQSINIASDWRGFVTTVVRREASVCRTRLQVRVELFCLELCVMCCVIGQRFVGCIWHLDSKVDNSCEERLSDTMRNFYDSSQNNYKNCQMANKSWMRITIPLPAESSLTSASSLTVL